jgi:hypothetical protein
MVLGRIAHPVSACRMFVGQASHMLRDAVGNTVFEPGKEGSHYKGSGSGSGDKEEKKDSDGKEGKEGEESNS